MPAWQSIRPSGANEEFLRKPASLRWLLLLLAVSVTGVAAEPPGSQSAPPERPVAPAQPAAIVYVTDEAEAVLVILDRRAAGEVPTEEQWERLFASEGYVRLARREAAMGRTFSEGDFRSFVLDDALLARRQALRETLAAWITRDPAAAGAQALAYLPAGTPLRARIYPVIKPRDNSFVFEIDSDPAIFLYLDPALSAERFANTLAHELHHIGFGTTCPSPATAAALAALPPGAAKVAKWTGAFGEGLAMLAAAGGVDIHPHAASPAADRERWDRDVENGAAELARVDRLFLDLLAGRLDEAAEVAAARELYGIQGPWYTVGWQIAVAIERSRGREALIAASCDPRRLLLTYDEVALAVGLPRFSPAVIADLR